MARVSAASCHRSWVASQRGERGIMGRQMRRMEAGTICRPQGKRKAAVELM